MRRNLALPLALTAGGIVLFVGLFLYWGYTTLSKVLDLNWPAYLAVIPITFIGGCAVAYLIGQRFPTAGFLFGAFTIVLCILFVYQMLAKVHEQREGYNRALDERAAIWRQQQEAVVRTEEARQRGIVQQQQNIPRPIQQDNVSPRRISPTTWQFAINSAFYTVTDIVAQAGERFRIVVEGQVQPSPGAPLFTAESGGIVMGNLSEPETFLLPTGKFCQPVMQIGNDTYPLGETGTYNILNTGKLTFMINDRKGYYFDNSGHYSLTVTNLDYPR